MRFGGPIGQEVGLSMTWGERMVGCLGSIFRQRAGKEWPRKSYSKGEGGLTNAL